MQKKQRVTRGQAIAYLNQYEYLKINIQNKLEKAELLRSRAESTQMNFDADKVQTPPKNKVEEILAKAIDLENSAKHDESRLEKIKSEILLKLSDLEDPMEMKVLELRHIEGLFFVLIADEVERSDRQVYRIYNMGIRHLSEIL